MLSIVLSRNKLVLDERIFLELKNKLITELKNDFNMG